MSAPNLRVDLTEWRTNLRAFINVCKTRSFPNLINRLGYHIAMAASKALTYKADATQIKSDLYIIAYGIERTTNKRAKRPFKKGKALYAMGATKEGKPAPRAALIINAARGRRGEKGLYGGEMREGIRAVYGSRARAVGYIRAGFLPAVIGFATAIGKVASKPAKWMHLQDIGGYKKATQGLKVEAALWNQAKAQPGHTKASDEAVAKHAAEGLQRAIDQNAQWLYNEIEKQLQRDIDKLTGRFFR